MRFIKLSVNSGAMDIYLRILNSRLFNRYSAHKIRDALKFV